MDRLPFIRLVQVNKLSRQIIAVEIVESILWVLNKEVGAVHQWCDDILNRHLCALIGMNALRRHLGEFLFCLIPSLIFNTLCLVDVQIEVVEISVDN